MHTITSADGTPIAYDRTGAGPAPVLVGGAFSYRRYPGQVKLAGLLAGHFTVYSYDRRGRGDSGDTAPYTIQREIEDLAAVIGAAGGRAHVWGLSSGAVLALHAATAGVPIDRLTVQEPPLVVDPADRRPPAGLRQHTSDLIAAGRRGAAVRYYMVQGMGAPAFVPAMLRHAAAAVAAAVPGSELMARRGLGHTKNLNAKVIAGALTGFLTGPAGHPAGPGPR